ncbi:hypothetical protein IIC68_02585, partial [archaeon]|nr:hypothetical protein [archaeon]
MNDNYKTLLGILGIAASIILAALVFKITGLQHYDLLNLASIEGIIRFVFSFPIILFALVLPLPYAIVSVLVFFESNKMEVYKTGLIGTFLGLLISITIFGFTLDSIIVSFFYLISIVILIETANWKKDELKHAVTFRTASSASHKAFFLLAVSLLLISATDGIQNQEKYVQDLGEMVMGVAFSNIGGSNDPAELAADLLLKSQKEAIDTIMALPQFVILREKEDPDVLTFVASMDALAVNIDSPETRRATINKIKNRQEASQGILTFDFIRSQSPLIDTMADYYWLITASSVFFMFIFYANLIAINV